MPILKRSFRERDPIRVAVAGLVALAATAAVLPGAAAVLDRLGTRTYHAQFTEIGALAPGNDVQIGGATVGEVTDVRIDGEVVDVAFVIEDGVGTLGDATRAAIRTTTVLGTRTLTLQPVGTGVLPDGATIPVDRTDPPYNVAALLGELTERTAQIDQPQLARALDTVADEFAGTSAPLAEALDGVGRLSETIASRDQALRDLLEHSDDVTGLLARRSGQLVTLLADGNLLLEELGRRRETIQALILSATRTVDQLDGLVDDNEDELGPALDNLREVLDLLNRQDKSLAATIQGLNIYAGSLGEAVGAGPWFYAYIPNLIPSNLAPILPTVLGDKTR